MIYRALSSIFIVSPLIFFTGLPYPHTVPRTIILALLGCVGLCTLLWNERVETKKISLSLLGIAWCAFFIFLLATTLIHSDSAHGILSTLERGTGILTFAACMSMYCILKKSFARDASYIEKLSAWTLIIISIFGFLQKMIPGFVETFSGARIGGTLGNAIFYGMYLSLSILWMFLLWLKKREWLYVVAILAAIAALIISATTGPLIGLFAGAVVVAGVMLWKKYPTHTLVATLIGIIMMLGGMAYFKNQLLVQFPTMQTRLINWNIAWNGFLDHPFIGSGWESYHETVTEHFDPRLIIYGSQETYPDKPHNAYLELLQSVGLMGFMLYALFICIICMTLYLAYANKKISLPIFAASMGFVATYVVQNISAFETQGALIMLTLFCAWASQHTTPEHTHTIPSAIKKIVVGVGALLLIGATWIGLLKELPYMLALHTQNTEKLLQALHSPYRIEYLSGIPTNSGLMAEKAIENFNKKTRWDNLVLAKYASTVALTGGQQALIPAAKILTQDAITTNPRRQELHVISAQLALATNNLEASAAALQTAISIAPTTAEPHLLYAVILFGQNNIDAGWQEILLAKNLGLTKAPKKVLLYFSQKLEAAHKAEESAALRTFFTGE